MSPIFRYYLLLWCLSGLVPAFAQKAVTLEGRITDQKSLEPLEGGSVLIEELKIGAQTDGTGKFRVTMPKGTYKVTITMLGYETLKIPLGITGDTTVTWQLAQAARRLEQVDILASRSQAGVKALQMGVEKLNIGTIKKMPALMGETDILKVLQFLPGVSTAGEGAGGFNVRGGSAGQNLILLDQAPIYNSSHLFGFYSVFNPDIVKDVTLYKGNISPEFGGRVSAVLDVSVREGDLEKHQAEGGIGLIFSRLALQGPLQKGKTSYAIAARRSYIDGINTLLTSEDYSLNFHDVTFKITHRPDDKNTLSLTGFSGSDQFKFDKDNAFKWGSDNGSLKWQRVWNKRFQSSLSAAGSRYHYQLRTANRESGSESLWKSAVNNFVGKAEVAYFPGVRSTFKAGVETNYYILNPGTIKGIAGGEAFETAPDKQHALEIAPYWSHTWDISSRWSVGYGLRYSFYNRLGPGQIFTYAETTPGLRRPVSDTLFYGSGRKITAYRQPEPRISAKYQPDNESSWKASISRTAQYLHYISNTSSSNPLNVWAPSGPNLLPNYGIQYSLGYFRNLGKSYELSVESYWKNTENEIDYINGAELVNNQFLEGDLLSGKGRAYGVELYIRKNTGKITGWASYTLSRSELLIEGLNENRWYPSRFDQTHNFKAVATYPVTPRWSVTADFVFTSGTPANYPEQRFTSQGILVPYNPNDFRNAYRLPAYHRVDLSVRIEGRKFRKDGAPRKNTDYWTIGIYNIYGRRNSFSTYYTQDRGRYGLNDVIQSEAHNVSVVGTMVPSVSYNFKF